MTILQKEQDMTDQGTILVQIFGKSPEVLMLDFFLDHPLNDFMQSELAERTGMNPRTIKKVLIKHEKEGILKINRKIGKAILYKLNQTNPLVTQIKKIEEAASLNSIEE